MEKRKQHKKINVLEGLEKEEKKEKEIINLDKEIGIDEETEEMFQEEMESSQENESVLEEEVSENEEILEAQEEIVEENNETEKISEEDSTEEIEEEQEIPIEEDVEDFVIEDSYKPKKKIDGRWFLICILCVLLGIVFYAGFKVFNQYQSQEKNSEIIEEDKTENQDTEGPTFIGFLDRLVINLNAVDVDYSKYYLAIDNDQQMQVTVTGDVNLAAEGEYPITVSATDQAGNTTTQNAVVQVISEDTMVAIPLELTPMIDGSIPMAPDTKQRVDANVILYYYGEVSQEIQNEIARLGLDVSSYHLDTYWHPNDLNVAY